MHLSLIFSPCEKRRLGLGSLSSTTVLICLGVNIYERVWDALITKTTTTLVSPSRQIMSFLSQRGEATLCVHKK